MSSVSTEQISFLLTADELERATQERITPIDGIIYRVTISFPAGCEFLVEALFNYKREQILPYPTAGDTRGIALDDFTESFDLQYPVRRGERIEMVILNHDEANPHTISAIVHIRKKGEDEWEP